MPRFDGTGPMGYGPLTGRGFGPCNMGRRRFFSKKNELSALEEEERMLQEELEAIREEKKALQDQDK